MKEGVQAERDRKAPSRSLRLITPARHPVVHAEHPVGGRGVPGAGISEEGAALCPEGRGLACRGALCLHPPERENHVPERSVLICAPKPLVIWLKVLKLGPPRPPCGSCL